MRVWKERFLGFLALTIMCFVFTWAIGLVATAVDSGFITLLANIFLGATGIFAIGTVATGILGLLTPRLHEKRRFCPKCGTGTSFWQGEWAFNCEVCGQRVTRLNLVATQNHKRAVRSQRRYFDERLFT